MDRLDRRRARLHRIYRRWRRTRKHPREMDRWTESLFTLCGRHGALIAFASSILLIPFSQAIVPLPAESKLPVVVTLLPFHPQAFLALGLLYLANAWLIDRHLAQRTPQEARVRSWLRGLRFAVCGLPLLGSFAIPGWRWILDREPAWAFREIPRFPRLPGSMRAPASSSGWRLAFASGLHRLADTVSRRLTTDLGLGLLELGNAVALGVAIWSRTTVDPEPGQRLVVAAMGVLFHLTAFAGMFLHLYAEAQRAEALGLHLWIRLSLSLLARAGSLSRLGRSGAARHPRPSSLRPVPRRHSVQLAIGARDR